MEQIETMTTRIFVRLLEGEYRAIADPTKFNLPIGDDDLEDWYFEARALLEDLWANHNVWRDNVETVYAVCYSAAGRGGIE